MISSLAAVPDRAEDIVAIIELIYDSLLGSITRFSYKGSYSMSKAGLWISPPLVPPAGSALVPTDPPKS